MSLRVNFGAASVTTRCHHCRLVKATWWADEDGHWVRLCYHCVYYRVGKLPPDHKEAVDQEWT